MCLEDTPYYHVTSRCVRRAFLCGRDAVSGRCYEHRRAWLEGRIRILASHFSVDVCAYAVMSNHYHLVVRLNDREPAQWSDDEVLERWTALFKGPLLVQRHRAGESLSAAERDSLASLAVVFRSRLGSLSWFMKCLNEPIARKANAEDGCTGHFWEARFHSQALCSEKAVLTAMAYVDLNPVRAGIADRPEGSEYTSIKARLDNEAAEKSISEVVSQLLRSGELNRFDVPIRPLMSFSGEGVGAGTITLPITRSDYLKLVNETGRVAVHGKRGSIDPDIAPILDRIGLSHSEWTGASSAFRKHYWNGDLKLEAVS